MQLSVVAAVFPLIFLGELPDETMFPTLLLASRGRPAAVWGDLTQILTANLAARHHSPLSVGVGSPAALWAAAAIAVVSGANLLRVLSVRVLRLVTAAVLLALAADAAVQAAG